MRILSYIAAMAILVASGVSQGLWSGRRDMSHALEDRVARLDPVPMAFGDWKGESSSLDAEGDQGGRARRLPPAAIREPARAMR